MKELFAIRNDWMASHNADKEKTALIYGAFLEGDLHKANDPKYNFIRIKKFICKIVTPSTNSKHHSFVQDGMFSKFTKYNSAGEQIYGTRGALWHAQGYNGQALRNKSNRKPGKKSGDNNYFSLSSVENAPAVCFADTFNAELANPIELARYQAIKEKAELDG